MQGQGFYGDLALKLVKEAKRTQTTDALPAYRSDLIRDILIESKHLATGLSKNTATAAVSLICLRRSKRCVLAYQRSRMDAIINEWWRCGGTTASVLPASFHLSQLEHEFLRDYIKSISGLIQEYLDIDLASTTRPPKQLFVQIRVVCDCGVRMTEYGAVRLAKGTQHYIKRSQVEDLIQTGAVHLVQ